MSDSKILIWYRNDLRIHDHEPLYTAIKAKAQIIPFYCFDRRQFAKTYFGFPKTGAFRAQFLRESVDTLRQSLQKLGSNLVVRYGLPEIIIPEIAKQLNISAVYYYREVTAEELTIEKTLKQALSSLGVKVQTFWGSTLYHTEDLPFTIPQTPELFTNFRKDLEKDFVIRECFPTPEKLSPIPPIEMGDLPELMDLKLHPPVYNPRSFVSFQGGETAGIARVKEYFWEENCLKDYKQTRNGMLGANYSSKFSAWLSLGCLSPRYVYEQVQEYENNRVKNNSTYWLVFELLWRDFFRFIGAKYGNKIFLSSGLQGVDIPWQEDKEIFTLWQTSKTGYPLVDANMKELAMTGFMSNRGRQNVASFLTKNLGINWQMGAEWFESLLIDYDVCSNWGNWNYTAGVGNDARGFRYFNIMKQSKDYDPQGEYIRHWLPEIAMIPGDKIHEPWKLSAQEQKDYRIEIGVDYPRPIVDFFASVKANEQIYNQALK